MNYDSYFKHFANKTIEWLPMDTEQLYKQNLKDRFDDLSSNGWIDSHFTYKFNSLGFRTEEFTNDPSIMFLGCSYTMGTGLPVEVIYPELTSKKLNLKCVNLGVAGSSLDTAFRLCHGYIDKIKPKIVVCMTPPGSRFELLTDNKITHLSINFVYPDYVKQLVELLTVDENNTYFNKEKNILAMQHLCNERNIKFVLTDFSDLNNMSNSLARDLCHFGVENHKLFSEHLANIINGGT